jgi:hypothetical protein
LAHRLQAAYPRLSPHPVIERSSWARAVRASSLSYALARLGISPGTASLVLLARLIGSAVNIPVARLSSRAVRIEPYISVFGLRYFVPVMRKRATVLAVNVGRAVGGGPGEPWQGAEAWRAGCIHWRRRNVRRDLHRRSDSRAAGGADLMTERSLLSDLSQRIGGHAAGSRSSAGSGRNAGCRLHLAASEEALAGITAAAPAHGRASRFAVIESWECRAAPVRGPE